jgi:hypothetical protein
MTEDKRFSIRIMGKVFESDEDGLLDLNIIANSFSLKKASQWRNKDSDYFRQNAKLQSGSEIKELGKPPVPFMKADEDAAIGYAMWVSVEFYIEVIKAFRELRNGNFEEAIKIAGSTMSEEDEHLLLKFASMKGLCFTKSCWYANIQHPNKLLNYLKRNKNWKYFSENDFGKLSATEEGIDEGIVYNCYGDPDTSKVVMRFTQKGRELLRKNNKHFNTQVEKYFTTL